MSETLHDWWARIQSVLDYHITKLGDNYLTLNGILKLLVLLVLVLVAMATLFPAARWLKKSNR